MKVGMDPYVQRLRAAAEPTRLRILAALSAGEMAVSDLADMLRQSQPRVSRHLRLLCDSGLLLRSRDQHWIYYRVPAEGEAARLVATLLEPLDQGDAALAGDRERAATLRARRASPEALPQPSAAPRRPDESAELAAVLAAELGPSTIEALLYVGEAPAAFLRELGQRAKRAVACSSSGDVAAADLTQRGAARAEELRAGDPRSLPFADRDFDAVILDRVDVSDVAVMREAARVLRAGGRIVVIEDYDELEARAPDRNPLLVSRERFSRAGLHCTRLRPLDLDNARLLLAFADAGAQHDAAA